MDEIDKVNVGGRPLKFDTPEVLRSLVEDYFNTTAKDEWTVTGLCLAIGTSRVVLDDYQKRKGYKEIVGRAKLYVENAYELSLRKSGRTGDIFALKNFGWRDKTEVDQSNRYVDKEGNDIHKKDKELLEKLGIKTN